MKSILIKDIINRIKTELEEIVYIDLYRGQDKSPQEHYPFPLPAILIEIQNIEWQNKSFGYQSGLCRLRIYVIVDDVTDSFEGNESNEKAIEALNLAERLWAALEGMESKWYSKMNRKHEYMSMDKYVIDFETVINEMLEPNNLKKQANLIIIKNI